MRNAEKLVLILINNMKRKILIFEANQSREQQWDDYREAVLLLLSEFGFFDDLDLLDIPPLYK